MFVELLLKYLNSGLKKKIGFFLTKKVAGITAGFIFDPKTFLLIKKNKTKKKQNKTRRLSCLCPLSPNTLCLLSPNSKASFQTHSPKMKATTSNCKCKHSSPAALLQLVLSFTHLPPTHLPPKSTAPTSVFH